ncbi:hypothetical protein DPMN_117858 [Dreissena polymorpha]|uniref:Uncharacterized protein n=1 Tax=Dreissena polymorpha TaxID=45954 RepID=A0A9D4GJ51_DREPO|nr:hypothetical protein DPMN_117858 [Dreissena polymorpha]
MPGGIFSEFSRFFQTSARFLQTSAVSVSVEITFPSLDSVTSWSQAMLVKYILFPSGLTAQDVTLFQPA